MFKFKKGDKVRVIESKFNDEYTRTYIGKVGVTVKESSAPFVLFEQDSRPVACCEEELELVEENVTENKPFNVKDAVVEYAKNLKKNATYSEPSQHAKKIEFFLTRKELAEFISNEAEEINKLFTTKNSDYGADGDAFANFRETSQAIVQPFMKRKGVDISEKEGMFLVLQVLVHKHMSALSHTGIEGNEVRERLLDVAIYHLIARAMLLEGE